MAPAVERTRTTAQATADGLRLFVAGIPWKIGEDMLRRDFEECGVVEDFFLMRDPDGNSKGKFFITYRDPAGAKAALAFDNTDYGGRKIHVKVAEAKRKEDSKSGKRGPAVEGEQCPKKQRHSDLAAPSQADSFPEEKPEGCVSLCLKGTGAASEEEVRNFLKGCTPQAVRIVRDRLSKEPRGIAFVDFRTTEEVDQAMIHNGKELEGQVVQIRYEVPKARVRPEGCMSVVVKKLPLEASEKDLRKLFKGLKSLSDVRVISGPDGTCTGLGFADFTDAADVEAACRRDGMAVRESTVFVGYETKQRKDATKDPKEKRVRKVCAEQDLPGNPEIQKPFKKPKRVEDLAENVAMREKSKEPTQEEDLPQNGAMIRTCNKPILEQNGPENRVIRSKKRKLKQQQEPEMNPPVSNAPEVSMKRKKLKKRAAHVAGD